MTTLDFRLEIGPGHGDTYLVLARADGGEATATLRLPMPLAGFDHRLAVVRDAVLGSSAEAPDGPTADERPVRELGQWLFEALVTGDVHSLYLACSQRAQEQGSVLRLVLRVHPPELARLPWEFLFDSHRQEYLGLRVPVVRHLGEPTPRQALHVPAPLRILGMAASPHDRHTTNQHPTVQDTRNVNDEQRRLRAALAGLERDGLVELSWVAGQTYRDLEKALDLGPWHVFHFVGHGGNRDSSGNWNSTESVLALADEAGRPHLIGADDFGWLLATHHTLRLVVLAAGGTGQGRAAETFSRVAGALLYRWIPAVVAMQFDTTDQAAIVFAQTFYKNIAKRLAVDTSVVRARQALRLVKKDTLEWGTPVVYLGAPDGRIFNALTAPPSQAGPAHEEAAAPEVGTLYDEALAAYWTERWDHAVVLLQQVLTRHPEHPDAAAKLEQARHQQQLATRYHTGLHLLDAGRWQQAVSVLAKLDRSYRDTAALLTRAQRELADLASSHDLPYALYHPTVMQAMQHDEAVNAVAFSPDGRWLATASHDETGRIWDAISGLELRTVRHKGLRSNVRGRPVNVRGRAVTGAAFSPDGLRMATASDDYTARIWDATTGRQLVKVTHDNVVVGVAFSPDGLRLATASDDRTARVWDAGNGRKLAVLPHEGQVYGVAFSPDGFRVVTVSADRTARIWDATSGQKLATIIHGKAVLGVAFSPDGRQLATAGDDHTARIWDAESGRRLATLPHGNRVWAVTFSPDGCQVATGSDDYTARIWDPSSGQQCAILTHDNHVYGVAFSPDGRRLATASRDKTARVWRLSADT